MKKIIMSCLVSVFFINTSQATTIYSGSIINDSGFYPRYPSINAINQSGLSHTYTSGLTDWDTYVSLNPTHNNASISNDSGALDLGVQAAFIDLDFGESLTFTDFGLWNDRDHQAIKDFNILISDSATFSTFTQLGTFNALVTGVSMPLQQYELTATTGRYVRVDMLSTHGVNNINFGEFLFGASSVSVPEPTSLALLGLGLAGFGFVRKRKQA